MDDEREASQEIELHRIAQEERRAHAHVGLVLNVAMLLSGLALVGMSERELAAMVFGAVVGQWMPSVSAVKKERAS